MPNKFFVVLLPKGPTLRGVADEKLLQLFLEVGKSFVAS